MITLATAGNIRSAFLALGAFIVALAHAQVLDSVHVFREIPPAAYTTASANSAAWRLQHKHAPSISLRGNDVQAVRDALAIYQVSPHQQSTLPGLAYLGVAWAGGRIFTIGITEDIGVIINFTALNEYRITSWADRLKVRALLTGALLTH